MYDDIIKIIKNASYIEKGMINSDGEYVELPEINYILDNDDIKDIATKIIKLFNKSKNGNRQIKCLHHWLNNKFNDYGEVTEKICEFCGKTEEVKC